MRRVLGALVSAWLLIVGGAARAETVVRWATTADVTTFDPHAQDLLQTDQVLWHVYDALVCDGGQAILEPCLAVSWRLLDPHTWEFKLREGVTFQDGSPFTAEDVVFSLERARSETSAFRAFLSNVAAIEAPDAHTVRITMTGSDLLLLDPLRFVRIMSKGWAERHGAERPPGPGQLEGAYTFAHANGTGPFILESFEPGVRAVLRRNPGWWDRERSPLDIDRLEQLRVASPEQGLNLLLKGEIDFLDAPPLDQIARIDATPGLVVKTGGLLWIAYLGFDQASPALRSSDVKDRNPFADLRVRQAVFQAIDFERVRQAFHGFALPAGMLVWPKANGWSEELDRRPPYDPQRARELLAKAGYPDGFGVVLDCPSTREVACRVVPPMLAEVGIRVDLHVHPIAELDRLIRAKAVDLYVWGMASTFDSEPVFQDRYLSRGPYNATGYADPEVDRLIETIGTELNAYVRDALIEQVWRKVLADIVYVPLYRSMYVFAMRDWLDMPPVPYGVIQFRLARVKK